MFDSNPIRNGAPMFSTLPYRFSGRVAALALLAAFGLPSGLRAEDAKPADSAQAEAAPTLDELDQKLRILERKLEVKEEAEATAKEQNATVTAGKDGFSLVSADKESA